MRCSNEGRVARPGVEPLLAPTPLRTKLLFMLVGSCVLGAALMLASRDGAASEQAQRGLVVERGHDPANAQPTEAELALAAARAENERRDSAAAARRAAEEAAAAERDQALAPPSAQPTPVPVAAAGQSAADVARQQQDLARARARVPIVLYGTSWCGACRDARNYMRSEGIAFTDLDVESNQAARATYVQLNPARTVPTLQVGGEVLRGFSPGSLERALDQAVARVR